MAYTHGHKWTEMEINFLKENYKSISNIERADVIKTKFGYHSCTNKKVQETLARYGIRRTEEEIRRLKGKGGGYRHGHRWTEENTNFVKENFGKLSFKEMSKILSEKYNKNVPVIAINRCIMKNKFYKTNEELRNIKSRMAKKSPRVKEHMKKLGLRPRTEEWKQKFLYLENNPSWQGGKSFEPYGLEFNKKLKEQIRKRDGYKCQLCFKSQSQMKYKLPIHHIDYNKINNNFNNLISLCKNCHSRTNYKRRSWEEHFRNILKI